MLSGKANRDIAEFISEVNLDTLVSIPDSYSEVEETGEARAEARTKAKAEEQAKARADTAAALRSKGLSEELIAEVPAEIDAFQKKRRKQA